MRYALVFVSLLLAACDGSPADNVQQSRSAYRDCLASRPAEQCNAQRAQLEADLAVLNSRKGLPPLVLQPYQPPAAAYRPPVNCINYGGYITCY